MSTAQRRLRLTLCGLIMLPVIFLPAIVSAGRGAAPAEPSAPPRFETRCGWFSNPTPANIWFYDRDAEWTIGLQGGYQVEGDWPWPEFRKGQWVRTNGVHGYGCVCMQLRVEKETGHVLEIKSARARPLAACRRDPALKKWQGRLE